MFLRRGIAAAFLIFRLSLLLVLCRLGLLLLLYRLSLGFLFLLRWLSLSLFFLLSRPSLLRWLFGLGFFPLCRLGFFLLSGFGRLFLFSRLGLFLLSRLSGFLVRCRLGRFFVVLLLRERRNSGPEKQEHGCCTDDSNYFHECCLHYCELMCPALIAWRNLLITSKDPQLIPPRSLGFSYAPTWIWDKELNNPKTFSSHNTTAITTTAFKMDLIVPCIGMKRLTSQSRTPTTIRTITS